MSDDGVDFVLKAVSMVAEHGWKLLPQVCHMVTRVKHLFYYTVMLQGKRSREVLGLERNEFA